MASLDTEWSAYQFYFNSLFTLKMFKIDFPSLIVSLRWLETIIMDVGDGLQNASRSISLGDFGLRLLWHFLHMIVSIWYFILRLAQVLESFLISNSFFWSYKTLNIGKVRCLAVVIDSEEARQTMKVLQLLEWLAAIGVKNVCLYDKQGVLKKSKDTIREGLAYQLLLEEATVKAKRMSLEFASFSDGKEAVAKAANFLFEKYYLTADQEKPNFTESQMSEALKGIGSGGMQPDLLLVYGPARCHLGFPAWRIRYTEIVHMGSLNHMKFGPLIKAIHKFTMVHQNYGT